jgi:hypothetical protein
MRQANDVNTDCSANRLIMIPVEAFRDCIDASDNLIFYGF